MATRTNYGERIKAVEVTTKNIEKKLDTVINKLDNLDERYPTRREFAAANWVVGLAIALIGVYISVFKG